MHKEKTAKRIFPIQLIVTKRISEQKNFWLWNLNNKLKTTKRVYEQYQKHYNNRLYKSVMDIIVKANQELFKEEAKMCQALYELFEDELMEMVEKKVEERAKELAESRIIKTRKQDILNLINNAHFTLEQTLNVLMVSDEERKLYNFS